MPASFCQCIRIFIQIPMIEVLEFELFALRFKDLPLEIIFDSSSSEFTAIHLASLKSKLRLMKENSSFAIWAIVSKPLFVEFLQQKKFKGQLFMEINGEQKVVKMDFELEMLKQKHPKKVYDKQALVAQVLQMFVIMKWVTMFVQS